jgi:hypothetical protein
MNGRSEVSRRKSVVVLAVALLASAPATPASGVGGHDSSRRLQTRSAASPAEPTSAVAGSLPTVGGAWTELTAVPYDLDDPLYADPIPVNYFPGSGYGTVGGRVQTIAVDGDAVYAGAADGGVWRSADRGDTWEPVADDLPSLSSGDLAVDPTDGDVWYATGEAAQGNYSRSYRGVGVFRSSDHGSTWQLIGGDQLDQTLIGALELDGDGQIYAATTAGLYRRSTSWGPSVPWVRVLRPGTPAPFGLTFVNDVVVRPGTGGQAVVTTMGWRSGNVDYNGLYMSNEHGLKGTWKLVGTEGDLDGEEIGRASLAYSSDGSKLYALVESWRYAEEGAPSRLYGVFVSSTGEARGPWERIADADALFHAKGSFAPINDAFTPPGRQAHYNQAIGVDPSDPRHVYVGLEELYETTDGGRSWVAAGTSYCGVGTLDLCPNTVHPDQHALAFGDGVVYSGNDGGVYRRPLDRHRVGGWRNLNRDLHALQYYAAAVAPGADGDVLWGATHDNGISVLLPSGDSMGAAHCCEASDLIVDPRNADRVALAHVDCEVAVTTTGGISDGTHAAWHCARPHDPYPVWRTPLQADPRHPNRHWVLGGRYVWETHDGWDTRCTRRDCNWERLRDVGENRMISALDVRGGVIYAAWCGPVTCDPDPDFASGIDTNVGGRWHRVVGPRTENGGDPLPNRWIAALRIDPANPNHVYAVYGEYWRPWDSEPCACGYVFESIDGGETWRDISGNLPDAAATDLLISNGKLVVAMEVDGVFVADASQPTSWSSLGAGLPNAAVSSLSITPDGRSIVAATHGRGLWSIEPP